MDLTKFKDTFINEAKEAIDGLNDSLLELEKNPNNLELINGIFRIFHTLKGNSASLGYEDFSELSHKLEDVLDKVRNSELAVSKDILNFLFFGADMLDEGLRNIEEKNSAGLDLKLLEEKISGIDNKEKKEVEAFQISENVELTEQEKTALDDIKAENNVFRVIVTFKSKNFLKFAKAKLVIRNIKSVANIIKINPSDDKFNESFKDIFEMVVVTDLASDELERNIRSISLVDKVYMLNLEDKFGDTNKFTEEKKVEKKDDTETKFHVEKVHSVRIDIKSLDKLMDLVGELLISRIRLSNIAEQHDIKDMHEILGNIDRLTMGIQDEVMKERMLPIGQIFNRFPRMVRDLAKRGNKEVNFIIKGADLELDRTILDELGEPLVHLLRNAIDHGIETIDEREAAHKKPEGLIQIMARRGKDSAIVEITDDGRGIDTNQLRKSLVRKNIITADEAKALNDQEIQRYIFMPGVSTKEKVTDVSGRGVGMDVVVHKMSSLGGRIWIYSKEGKGTTVKLQLPFTLAIIQVLLIKAIEEIYALPLSNVNKTLQIEQKDIKVVQKQRVIINDGKQIPLYSLHEIIGLEESKRPEYSVVIVEKHEKLFALIVDDILKEQQILIKGLHSMLKGIKAISGSTILGTGNVALILDVATMI